MHMVVWLDKQLCYDGCPEFQLRLHHQKTFIIHEVTKPLTVRRSITQTSCIRSVGFTEITSVTDRQTNGRTEMAQHHIARLHAARRASKVANEFTFCTKPKSTTDVSIWTNKFRFSTSSGRTVELCMWASNDGVRQAIVLYHDEDDDVMIE